jgi:hypothetical protein
MLKTFINKKFETITTVDIKNILKELNSLPTPYPWTPKQIISIKNGQTIEFLCRSPEVIEKLCNLILLLLKEQEMEK